MSDYSFERLKVKKIYKFAAFKSSIMIQRIQTVWLLLASLAIFLLFLFPYIHFTDPAGVSKEIMVTGLLKHTGTEEVLEQSFTLLTIGTVLVALVPLILIFLFKDRKRQLTFCYVAIVVILGYSFWLVQSAKSVIGDLELQMNNYGLGVLLPSVAILFIVLATKGIRKDDRLIKSADRLR